MDFHERLPTDFLIDFYHEIMKNIQKGLLTKNMYFELGPNISVASQRGITLGNHVISNKLWIKRLWIILFNLRIKITK